MYSTISGCVRSETNTAGKTGCTTGTVKLMISRLVLIAVAAAPMFAQPSAVLALKPGRDSSQAVDEEYTKKIREYTTQPFFNSPLTDYLPASKTVPTSNT